ncbi:MAG TPA: transposase [Methylocella sp.]|nr:transposase [Methylocella sp.]
MQDDTKKAAVCQPETFDADTIEAIVEEELEAAVGAARSARVGEPRQGYRHGHRERTLTTL